LYSNHIGVKLF